MKYKLTVILILGISNFLVAQKINIGIVNGVNLSHINSSSTIGRWKTKAGPLTGLFFEYNANKTVAISTQINYLSLYYEYEGYYDNNIWYVYPNPYLVDCILPWYSEINEDISYLRIPLMFKFQTPTRLSFNFSSGIYYSFLLNNKNDDKYKDDFGLIFSSGVSYNLQNIINLSFQLNYTSGINNMFYENKNGSIELSLGIGYILKSKKQENYLTKSFPDTINPQLSISYAVGTNISQNFGTNKSSYGNGWGYNASISLISETKKGTSFQTGIFYERKSYTLNDSSSLNFYLKPDNNNWWVDSKTDIDYISVPFLMNIFLNKKQSFYINFGLYVAFKINARVLGTADNIFQTEGQYIENNKHIYDHINQEFASMDVGWLAGAGYKVPIFSKYYLDFALRYNSSLIDIYKTGTTTNDIIQLRTLSFSAGFQIPIL